MDEASARSFVGGMPAVSMSVNPHQLYMIKEKERMQNEEKIRLAAVLKTQDERDHAAFMQRTDKFAGKDLPLAKGGAKVNMDDVLFRKPIRRNVPWWACWFDNVLDPRPKQTVPEHDPSAMCLIDSQKPVPRVWNDGVRNCDAWAEEVCGNSLSQ
jgi:hypothetical protein